ncbi:two-component system activity regulator YycH [Pediococcus acidilactici]
MKDTKTRRVFRHTLLAILAIASISLSWLIWTNPARYGGSHQVANEKVQSNQVKRDMSDVILPTQIIYINHDKQQLVNNSKINLPKTIVGEISKWRLESSTRVSRGNKERFMDYATMDRSVMLKYPSNITAQIFNGVYDQKLSSNYEISQVVINLDKRNEFFLLDDKTYDVYQIKVSKQNLKRLRQLVEGNDQVYAVKETIMNHHLINDYYKSPAVPYNSFLINKESSSIFTANLLTNTDAESIDTKKTKDGVAYVTNDNTKRILVRNNGLVTFNNASGNAGGNGLNNNIEKSFLQMKQLGVQADTNVRYFDFQLTKRQAEFRDYVGGFPIFNEDGLGTIKVARQSNELTTTFSIYNLQVPVPAEKGTKQLPTTEEVLNQLSYQGINTKEIKGIDIGYQWSGKVAANTTVDLEPTWYVNYRGKWTAYQNLVS